MEILAQISEGIQKGDDKLVSSLTHKAIEKEIPAVDILNQGLISGMQIIGEQFKNYEIFLPEVLLAAKAMNSAMDILRPLFLNQGIPTSAKIVLGTVQGDLHDLGKNLAAIMLKGAGYEIIDLGKNVAAAAFVETAIKENADIIGMSALLTTTMPVMKEVIDLLNKKGFKNKIKTIIGGAPISEEYAAEIGADAYAYDATRGVECVRELLNTA